MNYFLIITWRILVKPLIKVFSCLQQLNHQSNSLALYVSRVLHSQCNFPYTCLFFVVPSKCKPVLGLPDLMWLNLVNFNCRVSESWDNDHTSLAFYSCEEKTGIILILFVHGPRSESIFSGVGRFPVEPVNVELSDDAVPVQKPARQVPMSLKDKFEQEIHSMENQGIISKLDHNQTTEWLNSFVAVKEPSGDLRICLDPTDLKYKYCETCL